MLPAASTATPCGLLSPVNGSSTWVFDPAGQPNTAVNEDKILPRNPCIVRGADRESPDERPVVSIAQVFQIAEEVPDRYRLLVLLAAFGSMRWGEVAALRRSDIALDGSRIRIARAIVELQGRGIVFG